MGNFNSRLVNEEKIIELENMTIESIQKHKEHKHCRTFYQLYNFKWSNFCSQSLQKEKREVVDRKKYSKKGCQKISKFGGNYKSTNRKRVATHRRIAKVHHNQVLKISSK